MRDTRARRALRGGIAAAAGAVVLIVGAIGLAAPAGAQEGPPGKVEICHHTGSETNPIVLIEVANPALLPAHFSHGDTFPVNGVCRAPVVDPDPGTTRVTVCHRLGNGGFNELTIDDDALPAHIAHGDIYPVPPGGCNGTPPPPPPPPPPVVRPPVVRPPVVRAPAVAAPVTPAPTVVAAEASPPQELARTGMGLLGVELLLAASLMAVGALCLRHARRRQVPASWSCPDLPFALSCPDLPVESSPTEPETAAATAEPGDEPPWDARPIPALAGVGERARGAPPTGGASWLSRAGPPDDS